MKLEELDFEIPEGLIAQRPLEPRDSCRLMFLAGDGSLRHRVFSELPEVLRPGDTVVFNDSRVLPARMHVRKASGGSVELLFLRLLQHSGADCSPQNADPAAAPGSERWEALARPSHRLKAGTELLAPGGEVLRLREALGEGRWVVEGVGRCSLVALMEKYGRMPLPPYIKTYPEQPSSYQTVYAAAPGSAAAPTAGLHFTPALRERLCRAGIGAAYVTLHVGLDTFLPIREATVEDHRIHRETYSVTPAALMAIREARRAGTRIVAVGTTATRVLETLAQTGALDSAPAADGISGSTEIFITPGYRFQAVDVLLTNFHLPRSSVLALTMAFAGADRLRAAYSEAIRLGYRFFSFGDAMLIEPLTPDPREEAPHADL